MSDTCYPDGQGNQIDWNTNIITNQSLLLTLGFTAAQVTSITNDCAMEIFLLSNIGEMANSQYASLFGFAKAMSNSPIGTPAIPLPTLLTWPATMPVLVAPGIGARRSAWIAVAKKSAAYNPETNGRTLRLEPVVTPFVPADYIAELKKLTLVGHEQVQVQVGKGGGQVTSLHLMMRLKNSAQPFKQVGNFTARTYIDQTPLAVAGVPEEREYQLVALKNDTVIGHPSPIFLVTVS